MYVCMYIRTYVHDCVVRICSRPPAVVPEGPRSTVGHGGDEWGEVAAEAGHGSDPFAHPGLLIGRHLTDSVHALRC